jgi:hypothetical protein
MAIKISDQTKNAMSNWNDDSGEARLPFTAPAFWVLNGSAQYKPLAAATPALYFGGFATSADELETLGDIPAGLVKHDYTPKDAQDSVAVYSARHLVIAPFGRRLSSIDKTSNVRYPGYHKGASPHLQMLCYLAERNEKKELAPLFPVVITAKGFQVGKIIDAVRTWESKTAKARKEWGQGLKANAFYMHIGTFGDKLIVESVGGLKQSNITPIGVYVPENIDEKLIEYCFVGEGIIEEMATLREQAMPWLEAWKETKTEQVKPIAEDTAVPEMDDDLPL